jgi:hypothetical protein
MREAKIDKLLDEVHKKTGGMLWVLQYYL